MNSVNIASTWIFQAAVILVPIADDGELLSTSVVWSNVIIILSLRIAFLSYRKSTLFYLRVYPSNTILVLKIIYVNNNVKKVCTFLSIMCEGHEVCIQNLIGKREGKRLFRRYTYTLYYNIKINFQKWGVYVGCVYLIQNMDPSRCLANPEWTLRVS
jgi:hypothetical protein